jgi:hypothetical protein
MKTVQAIIELFGGLDALKGNPLKIVNDGYMDLCIEHVGTGPRSLPLISVAMYGEQCGDLMRDPDLVLEWRAPSEWLPVSFRNDYLGVEHTAAWRSGDGPTEDVGVTAELREFMQTWDVDLKVQGFLAAACEQVGK